jgi:ketosteroid isomerase-like protein
MAKENVENILRGVEAANRGDVDAFVADASPDVEWEDSIFWSERPRTYRGIGELREWFNQVVIEPWESLRIEISEITEASDDRVFFGMLLTARGKDSGVDTRQRAWSVQWFAGGRVTRRKVFLDRAEALEAAGLSE